MRRPPTKESAITLVALLGLLVALGSNAPRGIAASAATAAAISPTLAQANKSTAAPAPIKLLKVEPVKGYVGDSFAITGDGFAAGSRSGFFLDNRRCTYVTKVTPDNVEYHERKYEEKRLSLGGASADAQGRVKVAFTAPEDFGEVHDLYAVVDGTGCCSRRISDPPQRNHQSHRRPRGNANHHHGEGVELARIRALYGAALRQQVHR